MTASTSPCTTDSSELSHEALFFLWKAGLPIEYWGAWSRRWVPAYPYGHFGHTFLDPRVTYRLRPVGGSMFDAGPNKRRSAP